ncbi:tyrosinase family protein [Labrys neptuniae]
MSVRVRKNVLKLGDNSPEIQWYRQAVAAMRSKPASDPTSWRFQGAVHGVPQGTTVPPKGRGYWEECQHQTWFFLPWHRGYLAAFEAIVAQTIEKLGGPKDWALPYWDYTQAPTNVPNPQLMPPSFFSRTVPGGSQPNALWSPRNSAVNGNFGLSGPVVSLAAMNIPRFTGPASGINPGFGGPITGWNHGGGQNGGIENRPHNAVHVQIGGLMGNPDTAALDPIFWLHHCNIDRLWEIWRRRWTAAADPTDPQWRSQTHFKMRDGKGTAFQFTAGQMLDTTKILHGYIYDDVQAVVPQQPVALEAVIQEVEAMATLVGVSKAVDISQTEATTTLPIESGAKAAGLESTGRQSLEAMHAGQVWLRLENIKGTGASGNYNVYVDFPDDARPRAWVGLLSTFGVERASKASSKHPGDGLSVAFDITTLASEMGIQAGNVAALKIDIERVTTPQRYDDLPEDLADLSETLNRPSAVKIGRIGLYFD